MCGVTLDSLHKNTACSGTSTLPDQLPPTKAILYNVDGTIRDNSPLLALGLRVLERSTQAGWCNTFRVLCIAPCLPLSPAMDMPALHGEAHKLSNDLNGSKIRYIMKKYI